MADISFVGNYKKEKDNIISINFLEEGGEGWVFSYIDSNTKETKQIDLGQVESGIRKYNCVDNFSFSNIGYSPCSCIESIDLSEFSNNDKDWGYKFDSISSVKNINLRGMDSCPIESLSSCFSGCAELESIDLQDIPLGDGVKINGCFYSTGSSSIRYITFPLKVKIIGNCSYVFYGCNKLESLDLSSFDTSEVTLMESMFEGCDRLKSLDLSSLDTSNVTKMGSMFAGCSGLESLDLSSFDTSDVKQFGDMFQLNRWGNSILTTLVLGKKFFNVNNTENAITIDFSNLANWTNESVRKSLVINSIDRTTKNVKGLTLKLSAATKAALTDEDKQIMANKGYTIA